ncbi:hypothetical protein EZV62_023887 [Acer yangbiense]|uniref:UBC core domain-containing protein n=1 Tax=Acer yangbiense TaxID=1000413 RepID=A0A5C7H308_9ROSI|nr:hypothetical protein EZV62_023887 [Acer yangbiense]
MVQALSKIACNRLQKELLEWQVNPPSGFKHKVTDNLKGGSLKSMELQELSMTMKPTNVIQVDFPEHYPMEAPQVIFLNPTPLHPHIYSNGHICLVTAPVHEMPRQTSPPNSRAQAASPSPSQLLPATAPFFTAETATVACHKPTIPPVFSQTISALPDSAPTATNVASDSLPAKGQEKKKAHVDLLKE